MSVSFTQDTMMIRETIINSENPTDTLIHIMIPVGNNYPIVHVKNNLGIGIEAYQRIERNHIVCSIRYSSINGNGRLKSIFRNGVYVTSNLQGAEKDGGKTYQRTALFISDRSKYRVLFDHVTDIAIVERMLNLFESELTKSANGSIRYRSTVSDTDSVLLLENH